VSGTQAATLPKQMWDGIRTEIDPTVAAVSTLLIGVTAAVICISAVVRLRAGADGS
jgi:ABC-type spermidine/putrescine transport system permease subunit II